MTKLEQSARKFLIDTLTELNGRPPTTRQVHVAARKILKHLQAKVSPELLEEVA